LKNVCQGTFCEIIIIRSFAIGKKHPFVKPDTDLYFLSFTLPPFTFSAIYIEIRIGALSIKN